MRAHARRLGQGEEAWGTVGLLHNLDHEKNPKMERNAWVAARLRRGWVR
jgi:predicted hydrolase (HD superfamily)